MAVEKRLQGVAGNAIRCDQLFHSETRKIPAGRFVYIAPSNVFVSVLRTCFLLCFMDVFA